MQGLGKVQRGRVPSDTPGYGHGKKRTCSLIQWHKPRVDMGSAGAAQGLLLHEGSSPPALRQPTLAPFRSPSAMIRVD